MAVNVGVRADGSFDIECGSIRLECCYPGIDGHGLRPVRVEYAQVDGAHRLTFHVVDGTVQMTVKGTGDSLTIDTALRMPGASVRRFSPVYKARLTGARSFYRQGKGICGPSGLVTLEQFRGNDNILKMFASTGVVSLVGTDRTLTVFTGEHDRFSTGFDIVKLDRPLYNELWSATVSVECVDCADLHLPQLRFEATDTLEKGLLGAAHAIAERADVALRHEPPTVWCSWYYLFHNLSHDILREYLVSFAGIRPPLPFTHIQIDAGYSPSAGDWLRTNHHWPDGLEAAFGDIRRHGYLPGIWIAPFMVGNRSELFREHPEWMLRDTRDSLVIAATHYGESKMWGYRDEQYYVLDTSHPEAMEYLRMVFRTLKQWGARYFKTDFMLWGLHDSAEVHRCRPGKTSIEYFVDALRMIREEIGVESYWLGCIAPFYPMIGYVDAMRIAGDVGAHWGGELGAVNLIREAVGSNYMNHVYWHNDPDAMVVRNIHTHLREHEVESLCLLQAVSGGLVASSEPFHEIGHDRRELFRFVLPRGRQTARIPMLAQARDEVVMTQALEGDRNLILVFNPTDRELYCEFPLVDLIGQTAAFVRRWRSDVSVATPTDSIRVRLASRASALFFVSAKRMPAGPFDNLWDWQ